MTTAQMQDIADRALRKIAMRYGSTTKRDFFVIETVLELLGSVTQPSMEPASATNRSEAP